MALRTLARRYIGPIFHVSWPTPKHEENSLRGIRRAAERGYRAIDLDMQITKDGRIVGTHWGHPMISDGFADPENKISRYAPVKQLTYIKVRRLVAPNRYHIQPIERLLAACKRHGIVAVLEPKADIRFTHDTVWRYLATVAAESGATVSVRAMHANAEALPPARRAGFQAWEIA